MALQSVARYRFRVISTVRAGLSASSQRIHLAGLGEAPCKGHRVDAATFSPRFCCGKLRVDAPSCEWLAGIPARFPCYCKELRQTTERERRDSNPRPPA
jgi:hypothetical protein